MPRKATLSPLAAKLDQLNMNITTAELAAIVDRPVEEVEGWIANGPDADGKVLLRVLDNPHAASLAVEKIRRTYTRTYAGGDRAALEQTRVTVGPVVHDGERSPAPGAPNGIGMAT